MSTYRDPVYRSIMAQSPFRYVEGTTHPVYDGYMVPVLPSPMLGGYTYREFTPISRGGMGGYTQHPFTPIQWGGMGALPNKTGQRTKDDFLKLIKPFIMDSKNEIPLVFTAYVLTQCNPDGPMGAWNMTISSGIDVQTRIAEEKINDIRYYVESIKLPPIDSLNWLGNKTVLNVASEAIFGTSSYQSEIEELKSQGIAPQVIHSLAIWALAFIYSDNFKKFSNKMWGKETDAVEIAEEIGSKETFLSRASSFWLDGRILWVDPTVEIPTPEITFFGTLAHMLGISLPSLKTIGVLAIGGAAFYLYMKNKKPKSEPVEQKA